MKIQFDTPILDLQGQPIPDGDKSVTLASLSCAALSAQFNDETGLAAEEKYKRFKLGLKIVGGGEIDVSLDERALLKQLIGKAFPPVMVGRAFDLLDDPPATSDPA